MIGCEQNPLPLPPFDIKDNDVLVVHCSERDVIIDNYYGHHPTLLNRQDGCWFLCYGTSRQSNNHSALSNNHSVFVNVVTGDTCTAPNLLFWRSSLLFSPNGNYVCIDAGISASSARQVFLIDMTDLVTPNVIYREEIWDVPTQYECSFNVDSDFVMKYESDMFEYRGTVIYGECELDKIKQMLVNEGKYPSINFVGDREMWKCGVKYGTFSEAVVMRCDPTKLTPPSDTKWKELTADQRTQSNTKYGTFCSVSEVEIIRTHTSNE